MTSKISGELLKDQHETNQLSNRNLFLHLPLFTPLIAAFGLGSLAYEFSGFHFWFPVSFHYYGQ